MWCCQGSSSCSVPPNTGGTYRSDRIPIREPPATEQYRRNRSSISTVDGRLREKEEGEEEREKRGRYLIFLDSPCDSSPTGDSSPPGFLLPAWGDEAIRKRERGERNDIASSLRFYFLTYIILYGMHCMYRLVPSTVSYRDKHGMPVQTEWVKPSTQILLFIQQRSSAQLQQASTQFKRHEAFERLAHNKVFPSSKGSVGTNKDQHNSADPAPKSVIGELNQHSRSKFDYSTIVVESSWEPRSVLQLEQNIEDSSKARRCTVYNNFDEDIEGISGENITDKDINRVFDVILMYVCVFRFLFMLCTTCNMLAIDLTTLV
ncbi:hypothetical protein B296_00005456 [Ensete ventricosum]|uniref:Uncharacterized protein n=1 Tax=Ensete ventricosum TaxID=4639 RepID=A0A427BC11_ENSVE|nr:hypothetical protein B296_00005456 [Ensete ventricosum]